MSSFCPFIFLMSKIIIVWRKLKQVWSIVGSPWNFLNPVSECSWSSLHREEFQSKREEFLLFFLIRGTVVSSKRKLHLWKKVPPVFPKGDLCFQRILSPSSVSQPLLIMLRPSENFLIGLTRQLIKRCSLLISTSSSLLQPYHLFHLLKYVVLSLLLPLTLQCLLPIMFLWLGIISLHFQISLSLLSDLYLAYSKLELLFSYVLSWHSKCSHWSSYH